MRSILIAVMLASLLMAIAIPEAFGDRALLFAASYAALQIIADAIKKAGSAEDPQKVAEAIKASGPWSTAIGEIGYDEKGDITRPDYVMYTWKKGDDGKYNYVEN